MKVKVFYPNRNGKIEFTRQELEKLLDEVYREGQRDCNCNKSWTWTSPFLSNSLTGHATNDSATVSAANSDSFSFANSATESTVSIADSTSTTATNASPAKPFTISMKINEADINKAAETLSSLLNKNGALSPDKIDDVFNGLARELNF